MAMTMQVTLPSGAVVSTITTNQEANGEISSNSTQKNDNNNDNDNNNNNNNNDSNNTNNNNSQTQPSQVPKEDEIYGRPWVHPSQRTVDQIFKKKQKQKNEELDDLLVLNTRISLKDCVSKERIKYCAKSSRCNHLSCFDYNSFMKLYPPEIGSMFERTGLNSEVSRFTYTNIIDNEQIIGFKMFWKKRDDINFHINSRKFTRKTTRLFEFKCPVCDLKFHPFELVFDDFMNLIINHPLLKNVDQIEVDDTWKVTPVKEDEDSKNKEIVTLSDDENERPRKKKRKKSIIIDDDDDISNKRNSDKKNQNNEDIEDVDSSQSSGLSSAEEDYKVFLPDGTELDPVVLD